MELYQERANKWKNSPTLDEKLKQELLSMNDDELKDAFYTDLEFGTGGMRGIMGVGTNRLNTIIITKATLGFANYLLKENKNAKEQGVVIAHDNRENRDEFTKAAADVFTTLGIKVYIFDALRPTPELSFAIRYLGACGGINITASHNPKEYNGYKIYNSEGNQLILEQSNKVLKEISLIKDELSIEIKPNNRLLTVLDNKVDEAFYKMVDDTSITKDLDKSNITVVYTPQHGAGYVPVTTVLKRQGFNVVEVKEQCFPSKTFENTASPNPEVKSAYDKALPYAMESNADLICSNDPDSDRVGVVLFDENKNPVYMTGNQTGALLIDYQLSQLKSKGKLPNNGIIFNTIVTSPLGQIIANSYGVDVKQTLTGFKYIGDEIQKTIIYKDHTFLMGYEESYGYLFNKEVRDKDGVQSVMLICEMASFYKHQGKTLLQVFDELQKKYGYFVESQYSYFAAGMTGAEKIKELMEKLRKANFDIIADEQVQIKEDYLSLKKNEKGTITPLVFEQSNVLRYVFADQSFIAIRPSGTEPKCKFYFSISGKTLQEANSRHDKLKEFILNFIK